MLVGLDVRCKKSRLLPRLLSGALGTEWALPKMEKGIGFGEEERDDGWLERERVGWVVG